MVLIEDGIVDKRRKYHILLTTKSASDKALQKEAQTNVKKKIDKGKLNVAQ